MYLRLIPKLDIKGPNLIKGINYEGLRSLGKPNHYAKLYYEQGADEIIINDVVASLYGRDNLYKILNEASRDIFIPVTAGGGIRSSNDVKNVLQNGADKAIINTAILENPSLINDLVNIYGSSTISVNIEAKKIDKQHYCYYNFGRENSGKKVVDWINEVQSRGIGEIVLSSIDKDGTKKGLDIELLEQVYRECKIKVPLIFGGGIGSEDHIISDLKKFPINGIFVGSFFHYNNLSFDSSNNISEGNRFFLEKLENVENKNKNKNKILSIKNSFKKKGFFVRN